MSRTVPRARLATASPLVCLAIFALTAPAQSPHEADLQLTIQLPANARGTVAYAVFSSPEGFPNNRNKAVRHGFSSPASASRTISIDVGALPPHSYAVAVYLDENGNRKLDYSLFGIPKEPVGASNNPRERVGPPRFSDCAFQLGTTDLTIPITLVSTR